MAKSIYFVGKPYPKAYELPAFYGYKLGVIKDKNVLLPSRQKYADVIDVDFSSQESLMNAGRDRQIDGLVCTYENYIVAKSQIAKHLNLPSLSVESAQMSTDKILMRQAFYDFDPSITPSFGIASTKDDINRLSDKLTFPLIIKPANLVKSLLVLRCDNPDELLRSFEYAQKKISKLYHRYKIYGRQPRIIVEEYVQGKTCSIAAFVNSNGEPHFCDGIVSLLNAQDIGVSDNYLYGRFLPADFDEDLRQKMFDVARKGISALQMTSTPAHVELIYNEEGVKLIEIGARIGGYRPRMYSLSYDIDLIKQEAKLALGEQPNLVGKLSSHCAVFELFTDKEGSFKEIEGIGDKKEFTYFSVKLKPGQKTGPAKNGYKAAAVVIVNSSNKDDFENLCDKVNRMKVVVA